ncbi:MAG TPA: phage DNA polymerase-associated SH3 family protein [Dongiaceae bacterium]|nr:phage DNA polymerase-associated SH3 family protein [Dongiaceae bacterium]
MTLSVSSFTLDTTVSFELYPYPILGAQINKVKVTDILSYNTARLYRNDLQALHQQVYPYIPSSNGVPNDPTQYKYIKCTLPDGTETVYGIPWIIDGTVQIYNGTSMQITLDNLTADQQNQVIAILSAAGFTATNVTYPTGGVSGSSGASSGASGASGS